MVVLIASLFADGMIDVRARGRRVRSGDHALAYRRLARQRRPTPTASARGYRL